MRFKHLLMVGFASAALAGLVGCVSGANSASTSTPTAVSFSLSSASVVVPQDGVPAAVTLNVSGPSGTENLTVSNIPAGLSVQFTQTNGGPSGTLTFTGSTALAAGTYAPILTVSLGAKSASSSFTLISAPVVKVSATQNTSLGVKGYLKQFMSTSFQISQYTGNFFGTGATITANEARLNVLQSQHVRLQAIGGAMPMVSHTGAAADWDFTLVDQIVQPVLASADHSPEFQIATAPSWMCLSNGNLDIANHLNDFVAYAANLVRYYNKGGFNWGGTHFQSASSQPITWWGIFNEPNLVGLTATQYVTLYNAVVPAMFAVDPTLKFSALEFSDYGLGTGQAGDPQSYLPVFLAPANNGGVKAQVDALSTHLYGGCNQADSDATVFASVPQFVANINYFYQELAGRADLASVPVWVTENNVNADYQVNNGKSSCNGTTFVSDARGTSAFFAAWRPYVFSQLGKAGNQALYHWTYTGTSQYGEVDANGNPYLSYWVDRALQNLYPYSATAAGQKILTSTSTDAADIESLATVNASGTTTVMVVNHSVLSASDDNGAGAPQTVVLDLSSLNTPAAMSLLTLDATTNVATGPAGAGVTPAARVPVTLNGYGVAFLSLTP